MRGPWRNNSNCSDLINCILYHAVNLLLWHDSCCVCSINTKRYLYVIIALKGYHSYEVNLESFLSNFWGSYHFNTLVPITVIRLVPIQRYNQECTVFMNEEA